MKSTKAPTHHPSPKSLKSVQLPPPKSTQPPKSPKLSKSPKSSWFLKLSQPQRIALYCLLLLLWVITTVIVAQFAVGYPLLWLFGASFLKSPVGTAIYSALSYTLALFVIIFVPWKFNKIFHTDREELGLSGLPTWTDIGLAPIGFVVAIILSMVATAIFSLIPDFNATEAQNLGFSPYVVGGERLLAFITLAIVAPIAEEIIFRGWLYGKLRRCLSMPLAIFLVSLAFGIVHLQWNIGVSVFAMSIVLCALREITGTIYAGMLMHAIKNAVAFYLIFMMNIL